MDRPNRMKLQSADGAQLNLDALYQIAPSCFTEVADPDSGGVNVSLILMYFASFLVTTQWKMLLRHTSSTGLASRQLVLKF